MSDVSRWLPSLDLTSHEVIKAQETNYPTSSAQPCHRTINVSLPDRMNLECFVEFLMIRISNSKMIAMFFLWKLFFYIFFAPKLNYMQTCQEHFLCLQYYDRALRNYISFIIVQQLFNTYSHSFSSGYFFFFCCITVITIHKRNCYTGLCTPVIPLSKFQ